MSIGRETLPPQVTVDSLDISDAKAALPPLHGLLDGAYHNSHMFKDLAEDLEQAPDPFRLFVAKANGVAVGTAVIEHKIHSAFDYLGFSPVHIKRFTVAETFRSLGIGKNLLEQSKRYGFDELGLRALFGESNEIGAISMYGREGALYSVDSIREYWRRNTPEQAMTFFAADISDPLRRAERYPNGEGIRFVFPRDEQTSQFFRDQNYISKTELLDKTG